MKLNKQRVANTLRKNYPEAFGIRKTLQKEKVRRVTRHQMPRYEVEICENDPSQKKKLIAPYLEKYKKYMAPVIEEMEDMIANAPKYQTVQDKDALRTDMLFCRLAYGFVPSEYTGFRFEEKTPAERREYVSDNDMDVFGYSVNEITAVQSILDKAESWKQFKAYFKRDVMIAGKKSDYEAFSRFVKKHPVFVKKKVFSSTGRGIELVDISEKGDPKAWFLSMVKSGKYLLEERVVQSPIMAAFHESSVNTIRCITMKTKDGIIIPWAFMRCGRGGGFVDNAGQGGLVIDVNPETGVLSSDAHTEYDEVLGEHPDSGIAFKGWQVPEWEKLTSLCKSIAAKTEKMGYLSFDGAYTDKGWVLIEVNEVGQFIIPQIVQEHGIKRQLWKYLSEMTDYTKQ